MRSQVRVTLGLAVCAAMAATLAVGAPGPASGADTVVAATISLNGRDAALSTDAQPVELDPGHNVDVSLELRNGTDHAVSVQTVRFVGTVMGLPLFSYDSTIDLAVPAHDSRALSFPISVTGIGGQATGLIVGTVSLIAPDGSTLLVQNLVSDVHGSLKSVYGLFGLAVLLLTISSLVLALVALARHTLPQNRWLRATRFLIPGFGIGLVLIFTFSAFGVFTPGRGHWVPVLVMATLGGFALGYLTPAPDPELFDEYADDVLMAQIVLVDDYDEDPAAAPVIGSVTTPAPAPVAEPDSRATIAP
ncbi:MAG TPA: hypothetical protein VL961_01265 [Acidimicrobiales bacterium]|nr:hypothetical protein [Acidimicrobiales bacterium]